MIDQDPPPSVPAKPTKIFGFEVDKRALSAFVHTHLPTFVPHGAIDPRTIQSVSLDTVAAITNRSKRTWWRRITDEKVSRLENDARGRTMLAWSEVVPSLLVHFTAEDLEILQQADNDEPHAQNDIGQLLFTSGFHAEGVYWIQLAADKEHADAMQWLGMAHLKGRGVEQSAYQAIAWLAKAAAKGHAIAQHQLDSVTSTVVAGGIRPSQSAPPEQVR